METLNTMPLWEREKAYEKMYDEELDKVIELENKICNINKGIDELIKKYEEKMVYVPDNMFYFNFIQDLKKLKGE